MVLRPQLSSGNTHSPSVSRRTRADEVRPDPSEEFKGLISNLERLIRCSLIKVASVMHLHLHRAALVFEEEFKVTSSSNMSQSSPQTFRVWSSTGVFLGHTCLSRDFIPLGHAWNASPGMVAKVGI